MIVKTELVILLLHNSRALNNNNNSEETKKKTQLTRNRNWFLGVTSVSSEESLSSMMIEMSLPFSSPFSKTNNSDAKKKLNWRESCIDSSALPRRAISGQNLAHKSPNRTSYWNISQYHSIIYRAREASFRRKGKLDQIVSWEITKKKKNIQNYFKRINFVLFCFRIIAELFKIDLIYLDSYIEFSLSLYTISKF